jgi:hypothetical protein
LFGERRIACGVIEGGHDCAVGGEFSSKLSALKILGDTGRLSKYQGSSLLLALHFGAKS